MAPHVRQETTLATGVDHTAVRDPPSATRDPPSAVRVPPSAFRCDPIIRGGLSWPPTPLLDHDPDGKPMNL